MAAGSPLDLLFNPRSMAIVGDRRESTFYFSRVKHVKNKSGKPVLVIVVDIGYEKENREIEKIPTANSMSCCHSISETAGALSKFTEHHGF